MDGTWFRKGRYLGPGAGQKGVASALFVLEFEISGLRPEGGERRAIAY